MNKLDDSFDYSVQYSHWHEDSHEHIEAMIMFFRDSLVPLLPPPQGKHLLDIGCGMGFALEAMKRSGFESVHGIDSSLQQIEGCKRYGQPGEWVEDTAQFLLEHPRAYDVILMLDVLEHIAPSEQMRVLRGIHHSLVPGGRVIIKVPNASSPLASHWLHLDSTHFRSFTDVSLSLMLKAAGFSHVTVVGDGPLGRPPLRFWARWFVPSLRKWLLRAFWRQVFLAEFGALDLNSMCFSLNLVCVADK